MINKKKQIGDKMKNTKEWNITDEIKNHIEQVLKSNVFFSSPSRRKVKPLAFAIFHLSRQR